MNAKRLQIHLSTAIVLMMVAGLLVRANVVAERTRSKPSGIPGDSTYYAFRHYGWPCTVMVDTDDVAPTPEDARIMWSGRDAFNKRELVLDLFVALEILGLVAFACESLIALRGSVAEGARNEPEGRDGRTTI